MARTGAVADLEGADGGNPTVREGAQKALYSIRSLVQFTWLKPGVNNM